MNEKDMNIEEVLEIIEIVRQYARADIMEMATVMENALYLGDDQDWFTFIKDEIREWEQKVEWMCRDYKDKEEVKGIMMEFKKRMKVKGEALETEE